ncbi:MAG: Na+/H+ antiporter NhaA, partial [Proteobacteria bacterium]|nr:Na+/H+ antiporter NhaA [Pseudomonadota bacterium]
MIVRRLNDFALLIQGSLDKGLLLFIAAFSAIILTNIGYVEIYSSYIHSPIEISFMDHSMKFSVELFVNEFLMAIFFFVVGMEIKREIMQGHLSDPAQRILPIAAAIAGVVMPILIYIAFNSSDQITLRAWAVPAATDIAFALGVISIFGR